MIVGMLVGSRYRYLFVCKPACIRNHGAYNLSSKRLKESSVARDVAWQLGADFPRCLFRIISEKPIWIN